MLPELWRRLTEFVSEREQLISLNLPKAEVTFNPTDVDAAFYRKYPSIAARLGAGAPAWSGETVNRQTAMQHSVVNACFQLLTGSVGYLPSVLKVESGGNKTDAIDHPMYSAMRNAPNEEVTSQSFKETLTGDCMLEGDGFAKIHRRSGTGVAMGMDYISASRVNVNRETQNQKRLVYEFVDGNGRTEGTYVVTPGKPHDVFHLRGLSPNGLRGYNMLELGRNTIGSALALERNIGGFWRNGGRVPYHIESDKANGGFSNATEFEEFAKDWRPTYAEHHKAPILPNGMKLVQDGMSMVDAQSKETREWTVSDVARLWLVSPNLVGDLSHGTFSNIEQLWLEFKTMTLSRWAKRWEQDFWRCVLTPEEKERGYFLKINVDALLRGDFKTRVEGYASAIQNGWMNKDEVRDLEDRNPLPDDAGQSYTAQMNMQTIAGTPSPVEQAIIARRTGTTPSSTPTDALKATNVYPLSVKDNRRELKEKLGEIVTALRG